MGSKRAQQETSQDLSNMSKKRGKHLVIVESPAPPAEPIAARRTKRGKNLVIVESPAKAKTINKYLGDDYIVKASMGHVRDLPSKGMGVNLKTFVPDYEVLESRSKVIGELKKLAKESDKIYLATDLD